MTRNIKDKNGYNLIELVIVMALVGFAALLGIPFLKNVIVRSNFLSIIENAKTQILIARQEAARLGFQVVVRPEFAPDRLVIFANVDEDPDFTYTPNALAPFRTVDYELVTLQLPKGLEFGGAPAAPLPKDQQLLHGLTQPPGGGPKVAVFQRDGSIEDPGAFRIRDDDQKNVFEIRIEPRATARVFLQKFHPNPPWGGNPAYFPRGRHEGTRAPLWLWE